MIILKKLKIIIFVMFFSTLASAKTINVNCEYEKGVLTNFKKNDLSKPGKSKKIPDMPDKLLIINFNDKTLVDDFYNNESEISWTPDKVEWSTPMNVDGYTIEINSVFNKISGKLIISTITSGKKIYRESIVQFKCIKIERKF